VPFSATPFELNLALSRLHDAYTGLKRPRRWYTALILAVLVKQNRLREWDAWSVTPPLGYPISMTGAAIDVSAALFGTSPATVLRQNVGGVLEFLGFEIDALIVDPFRQSPATPDSGLCVVIRRHDRVIVPFDDPGWIWNDDAAGDWTTTEEERVKEFKISNDFKTQQGVACSWPATDLHNLGASVAEATLNTDRHSCSHWERTVTPQWPQAKPPFCNIDGVQCAAKGAGGIGPGGPRVLIPSANQHVLVAPGSFPRMLREANPEGAPLPAAEDIALVTSWFFKRSGAVLDHNRLHDLVAPRHSQILFSH